MATYNVFTRRAWRRNGYLWEPDGAASKRYIKRGVTEDQARTTCQAANANKPKEGTKAYYLFRWTEYETA